MSVRLMLLSLAVITLGSARAELGSQPAQSSAAVRFEVGLIRPVEIRPDELPDPATFRILPDRLYATTIPLSDFIARAYGIPRWRIVDAPMWVNEDRFDIQATSAEPATRDQILAMLRTLLEERFRLRVQVESREVDVDLLVLADRNGGQGSGLHAVIVDCETNGLMEGSGPGLFPPESRPGCGNMTVTMAVSPSTDIQEFRSFASSRATSAKYAAITMERLADTLSGLRGRPTLDRTGLPGHFDVQLDYVLNPPASPAVAPVFRVPSLEIALEEQLGLTLKRGRGHVEYLVVRSVERPRMDEN